MDMHPYCKALLLMVLFSSLLIGCDNTPDEVPVNIPDSAFLYELIANGVDKNGDGLISYPEAEATEVLLIPPSGIQSQHQLYHHL